MRDICPICGGKLGPEIVLQNPPTRGKKCKNCGRIEEIPIEEHSYRPCNGYKPGNPVYGKEVSL